jgi:hypothetical protein
MEVSLEQGTPDRRQQKAAQSGGLSA